MVRQPGLQGSAGCNIGAVGKNWHLQGLGSNCGSSPYQLFHWESHDTSPSFSSPIYQVELGSRLAVKIK